jgi:catechol 2,3-dioxygenase-like lactoylglutathione lyase family enzyme
MPLSRFNVSAAISVTDVDRAREFYEGKLGLTTEGDDADGGRTYVCAGETSIHVFPSPANAGVSNGTVAGWRVDDIEQLVAELTARGVTFERFDQPPLVTDERGIAVLGGSKGAWFRDPDGNLLGLAEI